MNLQALLQGLDTQVHTFQTLLFLVNALLHVLFAGAVARDTGRIYKLRQRPALVSGATWAFATLLGGVMTAAVYWFIHHSTFTRSALRGDNNA